MKFARWFTCALFLGCGLSAVGCVASADPPAKPGDETTASTPSSEPVGEAQEAVCNPPQTLPACLATCNGDSYCVHDCNCMYYCKPPTCYW